MMNWRLLIGIGDFLDLQSFIALRAAERSTRKLYRVSTAHDFYVWIYYSDPDEKHEACTLDQLLAFVGPVSQLPILKLYSEHYLYHIQSLLHPTFPESRLDPKSPFPKFPHIYIEQCYNDLQHLLPPETTSLHINQLQFHIDKKLESTFTGLPIRNLHVGVRMPYTQPPLHIDLELDHLSVVDIDVCSHVSFKKADTFEYHICFPRFLEPFSKNNGWPARHVILHIDPGKIEDVMCFRISVDFAVNVIPRTLEIHIKKKISDIENVLVTLGDKFPSVQILIVHSDSRFGLNRFGKKIAWSIALIRTAFIHLTKFMFVHSDGTSKMYVPNEKRKESKESDREIKNRKRSKTNR
jgi:hypothetical protein